MTQFHSSPVQRALRRLLADLLSMTWRSALVLTLLHAAVTFSGFRLLGEAELVSSWVQFTYFYVVTGSSVGYGDFSPGGDAGKLFAALWVIPGAISLFALLVGKIIASVSINMRTRMNGYGDYSARTGHIVVVGHVERQTERLLTETQRLHGSRDVVVVAVEDLSGRAADWAYVRAGTLSGRDDLRRAGCRGADFVVVLGRDDDESLAACLAVSALAPAGHVVAYFRDGAAADLVRAHCPEIEIVTSISTEQVARALSDPGAGEVIRRLVSTRVGGTLNSMTLPAATLSTAGAIGEHLRRRHGASLVGYRPGGARDPVIAFGEAAGIGAGDVIYYIAAERLGPDALEGLRA